jgi:hypothetical protein
MRRTGSTSTKAAFVGAAFSTWVIFCGAAQAGGAGADLAGAQSALDGVCSTFGVTSCPQLPTLNQLVIENSAIGGQSPDEVRSLQHIPPGGAIDAGTQVFADGTNVSNPLAFISPSNKTGQPIPTQPNNPAANAFLSATTSMDPSTGLPSTLNLVFEYKPRTIATFSNGQDVGDITLPFAVVDAMGGVHEPIPLTVQIRGNGKNAGTGVDTDAIGDLEGTPSQIFKLSELGMNSSLDFSQGHEIFSLDVPLIGFDNLFTFEADGTPLGNGSFAGIDPIANFIDASFLNDANDPWAFHADEAIAFDGSTLLSSPLPAPEPPALVLVGGALLALALVRRRSRG